MWQLIFIDLRQLIFIDLTAVLDHDIMTTQAELSQYSYTHSPCTAINALSIGSSDFLFIVRLREAI